MKGDCTVRQASMVCSERDLIGSVAQPWPNGRPQLYTSAVRWDKDRRGTHVVPALARSCRNASRYRPPSSVTLPSTSSSHGFGQLLIPWLFNGNRLYIFRLPRNDLVNGWPATHNWRRQTLGSFRAN